MSAPIRILVVEEDLAAYATFAAVLAELPERKVVIDHTATYEDGSARLEEHAHDLYFISDAVGGGRGGALVRYAVATGQSPVVLLSHRDPREAEREAMGCGAADYVVYQSFDHHLLDRVVRYAIDRHRSQERLVRLAGSDPLTGLANRVLFQERLNAAVVRARGAREAVALVLFDLDRFKALNEVHGHLIADDVLRAVAERVRRHVPPGATVARYGADEIALAIVGDAAAKEAMAHCQKVIDAMREPVNVAGKAITVSLCGGVALFPSHAGSVEELLRCADLAKDAAKSRGFSTYRCFESAIGGRAALRRDIEPRLRRAIHNDELELHFQPQVAISTGHVIGVEALMRWNDPGRGYVSPAQFIPVMEDSQLIIAAGEWVLRTACRQHMAWKQSGVGSLRTAVNVSAVQFRRGDLYERVAGVIAATGIEPEMLELEITEGCLIDDVDAVRRTLEALKSLGVRIAVDDFGTGYSSLSYLRRFPIDILKIDRSFVRDVCGDEDAAAIVAAIVALAHKLGLEIVAEGVETEAQRLFLEQQGCEIGQGYLFSPPLPAVWRDPVAAGAVAAPIEPTDAAADQSGKRHASA